MFCRISGLWLSFMWTLVTYIKKNYIKKIYKISKEKLIFKGKTVSYTRGMDMEN